MRKLKEDVKQKEERILFLSDKVENNERTEAELQSLQAGKERRGSNASRGQLLHGSGGRAVGYCGSGKSDVLFRAFADAPQNGWRLRPLLSKCQEKKKESRGIQRPGGAVKALQRLLVLILFGFQMQGVKASLRRP